MNPTIEYLDQDAQNIDFYVCVVCESILNPRDCIDKDISMNNEIPMGIMNDLFIKGTWSPNATDIVYMVYEVTMLHKWIR